MAPQPFSSVFKGQELSISFGTDTPKARPLHAILALEIIVTASEVETALGDTLTAMLGADAKPAIAMYSALRAAHVQQAALMAAAEVVLGQDERDLLRVVLDFVASAMKDRHRLAHWHWGYCPDTADAILLMEPDGRRNVEQAMYDLILKGEDAFPIDPATDLGFDYDAILVYRRADLEAVLLRMDTARMAVSNVHDIIAPRPRLGRQRDVLWQKLESVPDLGEALRRKRRDRKNTQPSPPQRRR